MGVPLDLRGPLLALGYKDKPLFDTKLTNQDDYRFNGVKGGLAYKKKLENYFISQAPVLRNILKWAEQEDLYTIDHAKCVEAVGTALTHDQIYMINAGVWGFLAGGLSGAALEMFNRAEDLEGLDAWRIVTRYITNGRNIRRETLRQAVKNIQFKQMKTLEQVELGVAEFENVMEEYARAGGTRPTDHELKTDLLHILPSELSELLLVTAASEGTSFHAFRDLVTVQAGNILMSRQRAPIHSVLASEGISQVQPQGDDGDEGDMLAALQKVWKNRFAKKPAGVGRSSSRHASEIWACW